MFLVNENLGDLVLTRVFRTLVREHGFEPVFCRKSDPQSKGKIENVVKYVKYNFLRGRELVDMDLLNKVSPWLVGTHGQRARNITAYVVSRLRSLRRKKHTSCLIRESRLFLAKPSCRITCERTT